MMITLIILWNVKIMLISTKSKYSVLVTEAHFSELSDLNGRSLYSSICSLIRHLIATLATN